LDQYAGLEYVGSHIKISVKRNVSGAYRIGKARVASVLYDDLATQHSLTQTGVIMSVSVLDTIGLKCPQPVLKIAVQAPNMRPGDILEILGDCPTFEKDVRTWCERLGKIFLSVKDEGEKAKRIQIQF
jgi:tRNA 2-thiouridine synthesizing protein A